VIIHSLTDILHGLNSIRLPFTGFWRLEIPIVIANTSAIKVHISLCNLDLSPIIVANSFTKNSNMKIKATLLFLFLCLIIQAQDTTEVSSKITAATVFTKGAMVTRTIDIKVLSGNQLLKISDLPNTIIPQTIIVDGSNNIEIKSVNSYLHEENKLDTAAYFKINAQIKVLQDSIEYYNSLLTVLDTETKMIKDHTNFSDEKGAVDVDELVKASEFYRVRLKEIALERLDIDKKKNFFLIKKENLRIEGIRLQNQKIDKITEVLIKVNMNNSSSSKLELKYYLPEARWYPFYDLKAENLNEGVQLLRKAYASQTSSEDWKDVKLTLSNADPFEDNDIPFLNPLKFEGVRDQTYSYGQHGYGRILDQQGLPLIGVNIVIDGLAVGTITDIDGKFFLENAAGKNATISYTGFKSENVKLTGRNDVFRLKEGALLTESVVVRGYTSVDSDDIQNLRHLKREADKKFKALEGRQALKQIKVEGINSVLYTLEDKFDIISDGKEVDVLLEDIKVDCSFEHFAIPSKSEKTFLLAHVDKWHRLDLLEGKVNLFLNGAFKGNSYINPKNTEDTLSISLGVDPEVIVSREQLRDYYDKKFLGKKIEESFTYQISIKNNKTQAINLKVLDQVPISDHENIKIDLQEKSGAKLSEDSGQLEWKLNLLPGADSQKKLSFKIKYPKNYRIEL